MSPTQREFLPMFARMIQTPMKEREHAQWQFGNPITFANAPAPGPGPRQ